MAQDIFNSNAEELRKIINENIWFGQKNRDIALEFLDACIDNYNTKVEKLLEDREDNDLREDISGKIINMKSPIEDDEDDDEYFDPDPFYTSVDYGFGEFNYENRDLNLKFKMALEEFIENFKNNK